MASAWDDIDVAKLLIAPWNAGCSALEISNRLGGPFSRNAIIAKIWRLRRMGVALRQDEHTPTRRKSSKRKVIGNGGGLKSLKMIASGGKRQRSRVPTRAELALAVVPFTSNPDPIAPTVACVADLEAHHCRWVYAAVGEPGFGFCGRNKVAGLSYCEVHSRKAFYGLNVASRDAHVEAVIKEAEPVIVEV